MLVFVGPKPDGLEVCHGIHGQKDNQLKNLRYGTPSQNQLERYRDGTACNIPVRRSDGKEYRSMNDAAKDTGISHVGISNVFSGQQQTAGNFTWEKI